MRLRASLLVAALLLSAAPAMAQSSADGDVRCFMASSIFAQADKDPKRKQLAADARLFFLGRVDARVPAAALKAKMVEVGKAMAPASIGTVMDGCAKQFLAKGQSIMVIGRELAATQKGAALAPKK